jgi:hypothetical protein
VHAACGPVEVTVDDGFGAAGDWGGGAKQPDGVHPALLISPFCQLASLRVQRAEHMREGAGETVNALLFQGVAPVVHVNALPLPSCP